MTGDLYFLDDLLSRELLDAGHEKPARLAVIGCPVAHSASPRMHQPALDEAGIDARYIKLEVAPGEVPEAFARLQGLGFIGCNVTVPHKLDAMAACSIVDPGAIAMGAVNTVCFRDGEIHGFNTDGPGFEAAILDAFSTSLKGLDVLIAGAGGGAGGALASHCARVGVRRLILANRSLAKIETLADVLRSRHPGLEISTYNLEDPQLPEVGRKCRLLVNTSSVGLKPEDPSPIPKASFAPGQLVFDSIYQPPLTAFLSAAETSGARTANGASMLLHQGVHAFQHWFPETHPTEAMRRGLAQK